MTAGLSEALMKVETLVITVVFPVAPAPGPPSNPDPIPQLFTLPPSPTT